VKTINFFASGLSLSLSLSLSVSLSHTHARTCVYVRVSGRNRRSFSYQICGSSSFLYGVRKFERFKETKDAYCALMYVYRQEDSRPGVASAVQS